MAPSHYLNQCRNIVDWTLRNKLQWNFKRNSYIFIQENAFENVVWKMAAICLGLNVLSQLAKWACPRGPPENLQRTIWWRSDYAWHCGTLINKLCLSYILYNVCGKTMQDDSLPQWDGIFVGVHKLRKWRLQNCKQACVISYMSAQVGVGSY